MKLSSFTCAALIVAALSQQAMALSEDDKSMSTPSGAARFSDPDEQTPGQAVYMQGGKAQSGDVDPNAVRYDYDPASGAYVPHHN